MHESSKKQLAVQRALAAPGRKGQFLPMPCLIRARTCGAQAQIYISTYNFSKKNNTVV